MITFALIWTAIGSVVWMLTCDGLTAEVRLRRMAQGKRTRAVHIVVGTVIVIARWPWTACKYIATRKVWG